MKNCVLREFIETLKQQATEPDCQDGADEAKIPNAIQKGRRQGFVECADKLNCLTELMRD